MSQYENIVLTKTEYKQLMYANKGKVISLNQNWRECALCRYNLIEDVDSNKPFANKYIISNVGKRYLIWYKKYRFKTYSPIFISILALLLSFASIVLSVIGLM